MGWTKIKRSKADILFSDFIRGKAKWRCEYCHKLCRIENEWIARLEASHYFGRAHRATRFDLENVYALCGSCHKRMGGYKKSEDGEYDLWVKEKLGDYLYKKLKIRANAYYKKDEKMELLYVKGLIGGIGGVKEGKYTVC